MPLTQHVPKCLAFVSGVPFIHHLISSLQRSGVTRIDILAGYKGEMVADYIGSVKEFSGWVGVHRGSEEWGTLGRLIAHRDLLQPRFGLCYADNYWKELPPNFFAAAKDHLNWLTGCENTRGQSEYGFSYNLTVDRDSLLVTEYHENYFHAKSAGVAIDIGFGSFIKADLPLSVALDTMLSQHFQALAKESKLACHFMDDDYLSITDISSLEHAERRLYQTEVNVNAYF